MKKIPEGAEASNVLVGVLDFLESPIVAFVRLSPAVLLSGLTEVPIPTRYRAKLQESLFPIYISSGNNDIPTMIQSDNAMQVPLHSSGPRRKGSAIP